MMWKLGERLSQMSYILDGFQYSWFNSPVTDNSYVMGYNPNRLLKVTRSSVMSVGVAVKPNLHILEKKKGPIFEFFFCLTRMNTWQIAGLRQPVTDNVWFCTVLGKRSSSPSLVCMHWICKLVSLNLVEVLLLMIDMMVIRLIIKRRTSQSVDKSSLYTEYIL